MISKRHFLGLLAVAGLSAYSAPAQLAISARAGMINYTEGDVQVDGKDVVARNSEFPEVKDGQELRTGEGRVEMLLTPGVFLRVAENSAIKMVSSRLSDARIEVLAGSAIVECAEIDKESSVTLMTGDVQMTFRKPGVFRVDADQKVIRTYAGEALVSRPGQSLTLKEGKQTSLAGVLAPEKFDNKVGDSFFRWAARRADAIAMANFAAARKMSPEFQTRNGFWQLNPLFGYFTFVPGTGYYRSFFGPSFYSPQYAWYMVAPRSYYGGGGYGGGHGGSLARDVPTYNSSYGYNTVNSRASPSFSGSTAPSAPAAAPAASPRGGESSAGHGGSGGRGAR